MGENQGVIWVLIGALVLGVAIFAMGKYFSNQTESQQTQIAFQQQQGVDEAACKANGKEFTPNPFDSSWTQGTETGTCIAPGSGGGGGGTF